MSNDMKWGWIVTIPSPDGCGTGCRISVRECLGPLDACIAADLVWHRTMITFCTYPAFNRWMGEQPTGTPLHMGAETQRELAALVEAKA